MEVDRGRNCYACRGFGHMARHCRNRGRGRPMDGRRVKYGGGRIKEIFDQRDNLKGVECCGNHLSQRTNDLTNE